MTDSETIKSNFPFSIIPREPGLPDFEKINGVHAKGKANCASVQSTLGGGSHGLLGLALSAPTYLQITGANFYRPVNPGLLPQAVVGTAAQMAEIVRRHKEELRMYRIVQATDDACKSQLLEAFDKIYFRGLRNRHTGFTGISYLDMITHLYNNFGIITAVDIMENEKRMDAQYDPSVAIESYFDQIETAVEFAEAGKSPFSTTQITTKAFIQMFQTGLYKDECKAWNRLVPLSRTWPTFKLIFTAAARELREMQSLSGNSQYANSVQVQHDLMEQTAMALSNLALSAQQNQTDVANVVTANTTLTTQQNTTAATLTAILARLNTLEQARGANTGGGSGRGAPRRNNNNNNNESYCHSHGRTRRDDHTSATCRNKKEGHNDAATLHNRLGGSDRFCGNTGE